MGIGQKVYPQTLRTRTGKVQTLNLSRGKTPEAAPIKSEAPRKGLDKVVPPVVVVVAAGVVVALITGTAPLCSTTKISGHDAVYSTCPLNPKP